MQTLVLGALFVEAWYQSVGSKFAKTMDVDLIALGGDLVNFPSPESVNDVYQELAKLPGLYSHSVGQ